MKAKLLLKVTEEEFKECDERNVLHLYFILADKKSYDLLYYPTEVDEANQDDFLLKVENAINDAGLIINSIPGLKLHVDGSIYSFLPNEEEVRKFINQLIIEI